VTIGACAAAKYSPSLPQTLSALAARWQVDTDLSCNLTFVKMQNLSIDRLEITSPVALGSN